MYKATGVAHSFTNYLFWCLLYWAESDMCFCFSFPPAATSFVLQQFAQYGSILKHVVRQESDIVLTL